MWLYLLIVISLAGLAHAFWLPRVRFPTRLPVAKPPKGLQRISPLRTDLRQEVKRRTSFSCPLEITQPSLADHHQCSARNAVTAHEWRDCPRGETRALGLHARASRGQEYNLS